MLSRNPSTAPVRDASVKADGSTPSTVDESRRNSARYRFVAGTVTRSPENTSETTLKRAASVRSHRAHPVLTCVASPDPTLLGASVELDGARYEFGRGRGVSARVEDPRMSRRHFRLEPDRDGQYEIIDLDTANGTYVDGVRIEGSAPFPGQVVVAGDTLFVVDRDVELDDLPAAPSVPEIHPRGLVGSSSPARALRRSIATVASSEGTVLLLGATGTGKEVTAQAIHEASGVEGEFVAVNCAAIPHDLAEAEFFGHVKGAFTGAEQDRPGYFEQAEGGTLFLDEVGDLPAHLQAKLLRVMEDRRVRRVGDSHTIEVNVRVVAATHVDLERSGFRRDLLARLGDWVLRLPRLADRRADVLVLWNHYFGSEAPAPMTAEFQEALLLYEWPMNVRELRKLARRVSEMAPPGEELDVHLLPPALRARVLSRIGGPSKSEPTTVDAEPEDPLPLVDESNTPGRDRIIAALRATGGNVKRAAAENGWHRNQLYRWLKRLRIDHRSFR
jgi:DNA-binding NtrC family response regulator